MQSRMMRWALVGLTFAFWRLALCQEQIAPDKTGVELINVLRAQFEATHTHSYKAARQQMFGHIDNDQGAVRLVYSGDQFETLTIPDHTVVNTEHTWPQSKFKHAVSGQRIKSDLHHLYPTRSRINSARGSKPFADIPDTQTEQWWRSSEPQDAIPDEARRAAFSESTNQAFEPREDHKGNVARSMFYIYAIYGDQALDLDWFRLQIDTLRRWHANDPVDASERARTLAIQDFQGNTNPFVLDPTLVERLFREPTERRPIRLISWNARELFSIDEVQLRAVDLRHFAEALRPDVLLLQKVTSQAVAEAVRDVMGLSGYEVVCSDFTQNDHNGHSSFEVAILSRFPLDDVVEFDRSLDNHSADEPVEQRLERVDHHVDRLAGGDHQHDPPRPLQRRDELLQGAGAVQLARVLGEDVVEHVELTVPHRDRVAVIGDVPGQVAAHDADPQHAELIRVAHRSLLVAPRGPVSSARPGAARA